MPKARKPEDHLDYTEGESEISALLSVRRSIRHQTRGNPADGPVVWTCNSSKLTKGTQSECK